MKGASGSIFDGWCWPGASSYPDYLDAGVRRWWAGQFGTDKYQGSTQHLYIWNDMNEPSVFNGPEVRQRAQRTLLASILFGWFRWSLGGLPLLSRHLLQEA